MASEEFNSNYLVLRPEEAGPLDLFRLLFSSDIEKRNFVDCPKGSKISDFSRRWLLFISVVAQKILLSVSKPLSWIGSMFELWLNFFSDNGNLGGLLLKLLQGKVVIPDKTSATFRSTIGNLDRRVELDKSIKHGDNRYISALSIMAAKLSYENEAFVETTVREHWEMEFLGFYNFWNDYQERFSTQAFMFQDKRADPELIVVAFRGTEPFDADSWSSDVDISWFDLPGVGKVHGGFMKALGLQKNQGWPKEIEQGGNRRAVAYYTIREKLRDLLRNNEQAKFIVTGHSLGGALTVLFPAVLALHEETWMLERLEGIYTFGQPRVGDKKLGEFMTELLRVHDFRYLRFVYGNDIVPRLPYDDSTLMFKHFGTCLYYNSCYQGKILTEEPNKNYFSVWEAIPKILNAVWELMRSFIIGHTKGADYEESWFLRLFRVIGLVFPGLPAHVPQDYVNATRLGSSVVSLQLKEEARYQGLKSD
ncbi:hypothetical protein HHK36_009907 [Tetracentron sinense]|uniref:Fungal lipase-type domain-containing protein n=1 Tax=Tetracentron sinense TaxID=13715 RepID=A0A834ZE21_TETSI|nr:hypothetical protein HHK36_009907 [Tetracentron sinense]